MELDFIVGQAIFGLVGLVLLIDDVSRLRWASICMLFLFTGYSLYLYEQKHWLIIQWCFLYSFVHLFRLSASYLQRLDISLSADERRLHEHVFSSLTKTEFKKISRVSQWNELASGTRIVSQGEPIKALRVIFNGKARVQVKGQFVAYIHAGGFIGEVGFLSGGEASATVVAEGPVVIVKWPKEQFQKILERNPMINVKTQKIFGSDLAQKLRASDEEVAG